MPSDHDNMPGRVEQEMVRAASLVSEIGAWRADGIIDSSRGSDDDDLLGAVEDLEGAIRAWNTARKLGKCCSDPQCRAERERAVERSRRGDHAE